MLKNRTLDGVRELKNLNAPFNQPSFFYTKKRVTQPVRRVGGGISRANFLLEDHPRLLSIF